MGRDVFRFCLSNDNVDLALMGPASMAQVNENLDALNRGPLSAEESTRIRSFGEAVHG